MPARLAQTRVSLSGHNRLLAPGRDDYLGAVARCRLGDSALGNRSYVRGVNSFVANKYVYAEPINAHG